MTGRPDADGVHMIEAPAWHLYEALQEASRQATARGEPVGFLFNDVRHVVLPDEPEEAWKKRAEEACGFEILTKAQAAERARRELEETRAAEAKAIAEAGVPTEAELRKAEVPFLKTMEELVSYINALINRPHDYGTCVSAMSMAATAAFNYVSHMLGATGFQASCADMDILRRTRDLKHGFRIVDYEGILYPQYWKEDVRSIFREVLSDPGTRKRFREEAAKLLAKGRASPNVLAHWQRLAGEGDPIPEPCVDCGGVGEHDPECKYWNLGQSQG